MTSHEITSKLFATFPDELALLSPIIRDFVINTFEQRCPDHFWKIPASTSGKYHPAIAHGEGGLVRHVKLAVWWGLELYHVNPDALDKSQVVAALLLHDLWKNGASTVTPFPDGRWPKGSADITKTHGGLLADRLLADGSLRFVDIIYAIGGHMGRWTAPEYNHYTVGNPEHLSSQIFLINVVHYADYCASRRLLEDQR